VVVIFFFLYMTMSRLYNNIVVVIVTLCVLLCTLSLLSVEAADVSRPGQHLSSSKSAPSMSCSCPFGEAVKAGAQFLNPISIMKCKSAKTEANKRMTHYIDNNTFSYGNPKRGKPGVRNGEADAFRHCYWACLCAQRTNVRTSIILGDVHEVCAPNPVCEHYMDVSNNHFGARVKGDCEKTCFKAATNGRLVVPAPKTCNWTLNAICNGERSE
jgi:Domain of unknown function (DUF6973)